MSASELSGLDREFNSLFRSQVRELESETLKTPVRKRAMAREQAPNETPSRFVRGQRPVREIEIEATPVRVMPKFKRNLVESRRAMRSREAPPSFMVALSARIPMTVLVATTAVTVA